MRKALQEIVDDPTEDAVNKFDKLKSILASQQKAIEVCENDSSESYRTFAIAFSEEMQAWLSEQKRALDEIAVDGSAIETREDFLEIFVGALDDMNILDCRIFMFMDTFYEFLMDWRNIKKQAAIKLLQRLLDKLDSQEEEDEIKESVKWIRRALAVLANPELRRKVWGF